MFTFFQMEKIPDHLIESYKAHLESECFSITRFFCFLTLGFIAVSGIVDLWAFPISYDIANTARGLLLVVIISITWAIYQPNLIRFFSLFQHLLALVPAIGVIIVLNLSTPEETGYYIYVAYLIIIIMLFFSWSSLSLKGLIANTATILLAYTVSTCISVAGYGNDLESSLAIYIPSVYLMVGSAIAGYVGKTINENNLRKSFLLSESLKESLVIQHYYANHDELTGLSNRRDAERFFDQDLLYAKQNDATQFVMLLDLNGFKFINDKYGHSAGDEVLKVTAKRLKNCLREGDSISRIGGDEFAISIVFTDGKVENINHISNKIQDRILQPINIGDIEVSVGTSVGVASYPSDGDNCEELLKIADQRMYDNKRDYHNSNNSNNSKVSSEVLRA